MRDGTHVRELMISFEANSKSNEEFASFKACLLALLKEAAEPMGDLGSTPPSINLEKKLLIPN